MKCVNDIMHCRFCSQTYSSYNNFELQIIAYRTVINHFVIVLRILYCVGKIVQITSLFINSRNCGPFGYFPGVYLRSTCVLGALKLFLITKNEFVSCKWYVSCK